MKVLRFNLGQPEWSVPLNELSQDMRLMLQMHWHEFVDELDNAEERSSVGTVDLAVIGMLERVFIADSTGK